MFKKLYERLDNTENRIINCIKDFMENNHKFEEGLYNKVKWTCEHDRNKETYIETLNSQQRTIEQLMNALRDKYEHGLFIFSEDGKIPTVIRNGKTLTNDMTTSFSIDWTTGEFPNIQFEQVGGTSKYDNE